MNNEIRRNMDNITHKSRATSNFSWLETASGLLRVLTYLFVAGLAIKFGKYLYAQGELGLAIITGVVALIALISGLGHLGICIFSRFAHEHAHDAVHNGVGYVLGLMFMGSIYLALLILFSGVAWQLAKWSWSLL